MYNSNKNNLTPPLHKDIDALWLAKDMILPEPRSPSPVNFDPHSSSDVCLREHTNRSYRKTERQCLYLPNPQYLKLESTSSSNSTTSSSANSLESIIFESIENVHKLDDDSDDMYNNSNINEIFDTENNVVPPIPPARKKRKEVIYENIWECRKRGSDDIKYEQFENDSEELSSPSNYDEVLTQASCSSGVDDFDFYTSVSSIDENIYENITPKCMYTQYNCRLWQSTPNLYLCSAEEVNIAYEIATPIQKSSLLTESKLDLLCDRVTVRKNSVTSDIFEWNRSLIQAYSSESSLTVMEEKSLLADSNVHSAESSPVQLRKRDNLSPTPSINLRQHFLAAKSKSCAKIDRNKPVADENKITIVKEGKIDRSKIIDCNGKQKKWIQNSYGCLTKKSFYLFENKKTFDAMKSGVKFKGLYELISVNLNTFEIRIKSEYTSRKNVLVLIDILNRSQIILHFDDQFEKEDWYNYLSSSLKIVPITSVPSTRPQTFIEGLQTSPKELNLKDQKRIKTKLKLFFGGRRSSIDDLKKNGIYKDEPVFGNELIQLCNKMDRPKVPKFVKECVKAIEPYLETEGIYRASGNLSQIQKIRYEVDQDRYENLNVEKNDIHVLTGALKLFFRELKTSLVPPKEYDSCMEASNCSDINKTVSQLRVILKRFPESHRDTLQFLMKHLLDVSKYEKENRMDVPNLATVWAPNLLEKSVTSSSKDFSMYVDYTLQMNLIKTFLNNFNDIFMV